ALIFLSANGITFLFVGRILSGLSAGLFTSTATATLVNLAPTYKQGKASMIASGVNMLGLGSGPLLAGFLAQYFFFPLRVVFIVNLILLIPACVFLWKMPEPIQKLKSFRISVQKLSVPK